MYHCVTSMDAHTMNQIFKGGLYMKRFAAIVMMLALIVTPVFAGGAQEKEEGPITLTFWTHEDPNRTVIEERYIAEFEATHPNITIERVTQSSSKIQELILTAFAANQGPDIFNMSIEDEYAYIVNGRVAPVDPVAAGYADLEALKDAYAPGSLDPVTIDGKVYGLPLEITNWAVYVNKNDF